MNQFKHRLPLQIRFNDVDPMGHINNAVSMEFFDLGKSSYFAAAGIAVTPDQCDFTVMIVHYDVDFRGQMHPNEHLEVCTRLEKFGNKSITLFQQIQSDGEVKVECRTILAGYDIKSATSAPLPEDFKVKILRYESQ